MSIDAKERARARELLAAATPGPWLAEEYADGGVIFSFEADGLPWQVARTTNKEDACVIVDGINALPVLLNALDAAEAENMCDACAGAGVATSGPCMCRGTGKMSDAAIYLREQLFEREARVTKLENLIHTFAVDCALSPAAGLLARELTNRLAALTKKST